MAGGRQGTDHGGRQGTDHGGRQGTDHGGRLGIDQAWLVVGRVQIMVVGWV